MRFEDSKELKAIHILTEGLYFPVCIYAYTTKEEAQLKYLVANFRSSPSDFSTYNICKWCKDHFLLYQVIYVESVISILRNPYTYFKYIQLKVKLWFQ